MSRARLGAISRSYRCRTAGNGRFEQRQTLGRAHGAVAGQRQFRPPSLAAAATAARIIAIEIAIGADHRMLSVLGSANGPGPGVCRAALHHLSLKHSYKEKAPPILINFINYIPIVTEYVFRKLDLRK
jgi:hypothetical protein